MVYLVDGEFCSAQNRCSATEGARGIHRHVGTHVGRMRISPLLLPTARANVLVSSRAPWPLPVPSPLGAAVGVDSPLTGKSSPAAPPHVWGNTQQVTTTLCHSHWIGQ